MRINYGGGGLALRFGGVYDGLVLRRSYDLVGMPDLGFRFVGLAEVENLF